MMNIEHLPQSEIDKATKLIVERLHRDIEHRMMLPFLPEPVLPISVYEVERTEDFARRHMRDVWNQIKLPTPAILLTTYCGEEDKPLTARAARKADQAAKNYRRAHHARNQRRMNKWANVEAKWRGW